MARKLRLEYAGTIYYVISRGNRSSPFRLSPLGSLCRTHTHAFQAFVKMIAKCRV